MQTQPKQAALHIAFLVASAKLGEKKALQLLVKHCHARFLAHGKRLTGNGDAAQDVVQQSWVEILRSLPKLRDDHLFLPWAYRIVSRSAARWIKQQQKSRTLINAVETECPQQTITQQNHDWMTVEQAISALPAGQQAALALFYREGLSLAEISVALDLPVGTVKSRLSHARTKLRDILERE